MIGWARDRAGDDNSIIVALGGNVAPAGSDVSRTLEAALAAFQAMGLRVLRRSRLWRSAAWPNPAEPPFLNIVAMVNTACDPQQTLRALHALEGSAGRVRDLTNAPRTLDLDLIAYGRVVSLASPVLPHPRAAERLFVMGPLAEIAPQWRHPVTGLLAVDLAAAATIGRDAVPVESSS